MLSCRGNARVGEACVLSESALVHLRCQRPLVSKAIVLACTVIEIYLTLLLILVRTKAKQTQGYPVTGWYVIFVSLRLRNPLSVLAVLLN